MQPVTLAEGLHVPATGETLSAREVTTKHHAFLVVEQPASPTRPADAGAPLELKTLDWSAWPAGSTYRREDLYGDDGR